MLKSIFYRRVPPYIMEDKDDVWEKRTWVWITAMVIIGLVLYNKALADATGYLIDELYDDQPFTTYCDYNFDEWGFEVTVVVAGHTPCPARVTLHTH